ncbi:MAG: SAM-dependent methyltransferase [Rhodoferax sp.]
MTAQPLHAPGGAGLPEAASAALPHAPAAPNAAEPALAARIAQQIQDAGGWIGFDAFMHAALYTPGLGYYARDRVKLGPLPYQTSAQGQRVAGSDFVTAPELSPLFGWALAHAVHDALHATGTDTVWEFGAGSGALARQILQAFAAQGWPLPRYRIVEVSASLNALQRATLAEHADTVDWPQTLPDSLSGVLLGNEVLDAMPVQLLARVRGQWFERGVALRPDATLSWQDRPTALRPPIEIDGEHDYLTEIHPQAEAFVRTLGKRLARGAMFWIDYGFPEAEYYHPQRIGGTLMCHQAHRADDNPLLAVGDKDITAHINFTGIALAANDVGLDVLGYSNQAWFLINCGLPALLEAADAPRRIMAQRLILEHEMGELFKVIGLVKGPGWPALGFARGDKTHTL